MTTRRNRDVLGRRLSGKATAFPRRERTARARKWCERTSFDLVLLDIMMPEIDGYQVLSQMKADPALRDIPVIMISRARRDPERGPLHRDAERRIISTSRSTRCCCGARIGACLEKKRLRDEQKRKTRRAGAGH